MDNRRHSQDDTPSGDGYFGREDEKPSGQEETTRDRSGGETVGKAQDDEFESDDEADAEEDEAEQGTDQF